MKSVLCCLWLSVYLHVQKPRDLEHEFRECQSECETLRLVWRLIRPAIVACLPSNTSGSKHLVAHDATEGARWQSESPQQAGKETCPTHRDAKATAKALGHCQALRAAEFGPSSTTWRLAHGGAFLPERGRLDRDAWPSLRAAISSHWDGRGSPLPVTSAMRGSARRSAAPAFELQGLNVYGLGAKQSSCGVSPWVSFSGMTEA